MLTAQRNSRSTGTVQNSLLKQAFFHCKVAATALTLLAPSSFNGSQANAASDKADGSLAPAPLVEKTSTRTSGPQLFSLSSTNFPAIAGTNNTSTSKTNAVKLICDQPTRIATDLSTPCLGFFDLKRTAAFGMNSNGETVPVAQAGSLNILGFIPLYDYSTKYLADGKKEGGRFYLFGVRIWGNGKDKGDKSVGLTKEALANSSISRDIPGFDSEYERQVDRQAAPLVRGIFDAKVGAVSNRLVTANNAGAITNNTILAENPLAPKKGFATPSLAGQ